MRPYLLAILLTVPANLTFAQRPVTFPLRDHSAQIRADLYGSGDRAVLLAHGGRFNKESWKKQAELLASSGFLVLALQFRGDTVNPDGSPSAEGSAQDNAADVRAAAAYLHQRGSKTIFAIGASLGGDAVGDTAAASPEDFISRMIFLGSSGGDHPEALRGRKLYIVARQDRNDDGFRLESISRHFAQAPEPKKLVVLEGSAHAQFLFDTDQAKRLMKEIVDFLTQP